MPCSIQAFIFDVTLKKARTNGVVFMGGNAGVLSAFRTQDGQETFGYLPQSGLANLKTIAGIIRGWNGTPILLTMHAPRA